MSIVTLPNADSKFLSGQPAYGTDVSGNVDTLLNDYNGGITNANISASAAIGDTKLDQIKTAGKVATTALPLTLTPQTTGFTISGGTSSKTLTVTGDATISGTSLVAASTAEMLAGTSNTVAATPLNTRSHQGVVKAWASVTYSGGTPTLNDNYNVTSITDSGTGSLTVTWDVDFASTNYAVIATALAAAADNTWANITSKAVGSCVIQVRNPGSGTVDPLGIDVIAIGDTV